VSPLERKARMPPHDSPTTHSVETQLLDECTKAAGVTIEAEPFRWVG
jgi:hypothetical protein